MTREKEGIDITTGWLNINTGCNNRCIWCYRQDDLGNNSKKMPFLRALQIVDFFAALGVHSCIFIGGEPTLYKKLDSLILRARKVGISEITIVTNGRLLYNENLVQNYIKAGINVFSISVHSAFEDVHDSISLVPSWKETIKGIRNVVASGAECSINLVVGNQNFSSIIESINIFLSMGVNKIVITCALPNISDGLIDGENSLDPKKFSYLVSQMLDMPSKVVIMNELPLCILDREVFLLLMKQGRLGYGCHVGLGKGLSVDVDGHIIPCNSFANYPMLNLFDGDRIKYKPEEFLKLWKEDPTVMAVRDSVNVMRSPICQKCDLWSMCNCGCPLTWGHFDPAEYINESLLGFRAGNFSSP